jgi:prepilin peptidase CpaA
MHLVYAFNSVNTHIIIEVMYAATLCYGCASDIRRLKIPNSVSILVFVLFFVNHSLLASPDSITRHFLVGGGTLIFGFGLYAVGFVGAGDIKLISALMLWAGPRDGFDFLVVMTIIGGLFAGLLLILQRSMAIWPPASRFIPSSRIRSWAKLGIFPYGVAICGAGLILMPSFFG